VRRSKLHHKTCGVPGRAACQLAALKQDDVCPAKLCQMIGDTRSDNSAADYDNLGVFRQLHVFNPQDMDHFFQRPLEMEKGVREGASELSAV
jgi:hypothetical protein